MGLDHVEKLFYGAAPMKRETIIFYAQLNMPVVGVYGLSETSAAATLQEFPEADLFKCGKPLAGTEIKIFDPNDAGIGEICVKGRNVFMGYLKNPKETWSVFDPEGYFHTGDRGRIDERG